MNIVKVERKSQTLPPVESVTLSLTRVEVNVLIYVYYKIAGPNFHDKGNGLFISGGSSLGCGLDIALSEVRDTLRKIGSELESVVKG